MALAQRSPLPRPVYTPVSPFLTLADPTSPRTQAIRSFSEGYFLLKRLRRNARQLAMEKDSPMARQAEQWLSRSEALLAQYDRLTEEAAMLEHQLQHAEASPARC